MSGTTADFFYWNDWASDIELHTCSLAAQGFWMHLLCIAAQSTEKGYVLVNGKRPSFEDLSRITGATVDEAKSYTKELLEKGVASQSPGRVLFNRRMVRHERRRRASAEGGVKGGKVTHEKGLGIHATRGGKSESTRARPLPLPVPIPEKKEVPSLERESCSGESIGSEPSKTKAAEQNASPVEKPIIEIPTNKTGESFPVFRSLIVEYQRDYPSVDIEQQIRAMRAWSVSNPAKRKTKKGMPRFMNSWLARAQDRGNGHAPARVEIIEKIASERRLWLREYAIDGRWVSNSSGNGVWIDTHGVGPPPHDARTLVTDEDLALYPKAVAMRDRLRKVIEGSEPPML